MRIRAQNNLFLLSFALAAIVALALYFHIARIQNEKNSDLNQSDQGAYIEFAVSSYETRWQETGGRARMPLFPWVIALFYSPGLTEEAYFAVGKVLNTIMSGWILCLLAAVFVRRFSLIYAIYASFCIAFLVFVLKSPFFQAEILLYGLFAAAFICAIDTLLKPSGWKGGLVVGILLALAHFAKAVGLLFLLLYIAVQCLQFAINSATRKLPSPPLSQVLRSTLVPAAVCAIAFLALLSPYLNESHQRYGLHFYNVNTTFYMWYESWGEAKIGTKAAGDREGWPDLPPEEIPSLRKYLQEHTLSQIADRFFRGANKLIDHSCTETRYRYEYGFCSQFALGLLCLAVALPFLLWRMSRRELQQHAGLITFVVGLLLLYTASAVWYAGLGAAGPRALLTLAVPFFYTLGLVMHSQAVSSIKLQLFSRQFRLISVVYGVLCILLIYEIYLVLVFRAAAMYGGK